MESMKVCCKCKCEWLMSHFPADKRSSDGKGCICKKCRSDYQKIYRQNNKEKLKEYQSVYRKDNKAKQRIHAEEWVRENPEKRKAAQEKYRANNAEVVKESNSKWAKKNKVNLRIKAHNRRARIKGSGGVLSKGVTAKLFKLQRGKCVCCGKPLGENFHVDHIVPVARGGRNVDLNVQLLRQRCNQQKNAKDPVDFMQERGFLL